MGLGRHIIESPFYVLNDFVKVLFYLPEFQRDFVENLDGQVFVVVLLVADLLLNHLFHHGLEQFERLMLYALV